MRTRGALAAALTAVAVTALSAACAGPESAYERFQVDTAEGTPVHHVAEDAAPSLVLWVSNQSFREDEVGITVQIDGVPLVDGPFPVQDENNWMSFPLAMAPGQHELVARSTEGTRLEETFSTPAAPAGVHAMLSYWFPFEPGSRPFFDLMLSDEPLQFGTQLGTQLG